MVVDAVVFLDVFGPGVHGPMGGRVGHVHEERPVAVILGVVANVLGRVLADGVGVEKVGRVGADQFIVAGERVRVVEAAGAVDSSEEMVKPALKRPVELLVFAVRPRLFGHVPFPGGVRAIPGRSHGFADRQAMPVQPGRIAGKPPIPKHVPDPRLMRIQPGQQRTPRRAASARIVKLRKTNAALCQPVEVRRVDFAPVATDIGVAHVVRHDEDDIGPGFIGLILAGPVLGGEEAVCDKADDQGENGGDAVHGLDFEGNRSGYWEK